ncbi:MAG: DUF882 domain-containing protein [Elusimicrobiales bacterium]|nr:DUF882 domain-containing protein [Elusimicrobiales bacterium]
MAKRMFVAAFAACLLGYPVGFVCAQEGDEEKVTADLEAADAEEIEPVDAGAAEAGEPGGQPSAVKAKAAADLDKASGNPSVALPEPVAELKPADFPMGGKELELNRVDAAAEKEFIAANPPSAAPSVPEGETAGDSGALPAEAPVEKAAPESVVVRQPEAAPQPGGETAAAPAQEAERSSPWTAPAGDGFVEKWNGFARARPRPAAAAPSKSRFGGGGSIKIRNSHTGESLSLKYRGARGGYAPDAAARISRIFRCRLTGIRVPIPIKLIELLDAVAGGRTIHLHSGYRSPRLNRKVGGARQSQHLRGAAADVVVSGLSARTVYARAGKWRAGAVILYPRQNFVHIDVGPTKKSWVTGGKSKRKTVRHRRGARRR